MAALAYNNSSIHKRKKLNHVKTYNGYYISNVQVADVVIAEYDGEGPG